MLTMAFQRLLCPEILGESKLSITMDISGHLYHKVHGEAARIMDIERVVFASTTLLILGALKADSKGPFHEDFPMNVISNRPKNIYPITKLTCEYLGLSYHDLYGVDFVTVRFGSVFGPWLGVTSGIPGRTIDQFAKPAVAGKKIIIEDTMLSYAGGSDFIYSKDAAKSCVCACFAVSSKVKFRIYNVTGGQFLSFQELIDTAKKVFPDAEIEVRQISELGSARTPYPKYEPTDISKAREEIGYIPDYDMENALKDYAEWLRKYYI